MSWFKSNKVEARIANILKGTSNPSSLIGDNGQLYLKYIDIADAYLLREYIEVGNTAGPYINTGLTTSSNDAKLTTEAEVIYSYTDRPDHNTWMFGAFSGYGIILGYQNGQTEGYVGSGGKLLDYDTNVHTVEFKDGGLYADDTLKQTGNWTQIPNNTPIYIFGRGGDNRVIKNTRIYRCKIWQNGVLLRDLIPVQRKSDDEIGMLDLVNNVFYDNDGTGSFTCGGTSDISSPIFKSYAKVNGQWQNLIGTNISDIAYTSNPSRAISYLKWQITKLRSVPAGGCLQVAEFRLYQNAEKYVWNSNVSISSDMTGVSGETIDNLIDDNVNTKFNSTDWGDTQINECNIIINLGEEIVLTSTSSYCFVTANDEISRDPVSWRLYSSADGINWDLLDERIDADIPTDRERQTFNYSFNIGNENGNATVKHGTFVSASTQHGIVDIDCGFKPDMIMVKLPFTGGDTVSYWEKGLSYAQNSAIWCLVPAESVTYEVALGRQSGETGIQQINNNGFSFMSNGGNTQGITCEYFAIKYKVEPTPFKKEILHSILQDQSGSTVPVSVTFTEDYPIAFICGLIADNVGTGAISVNALGGASELYGDYWERYVSAGIAIQLPRNKTLTGYFPYSDGGAYYDIFGAIGMNRLPSEYEVKATIDTSSISIELSKVYDHVVVFVGMNSADSNSITLDMNGTSIPLTIESEKFSRYSYHASQELINDSTTLNFTYSGGTVNDNTIVVFAYNE